jgi:hypothetical protein
MFDVFCGEVEAAPMMRECPVNVEYRLGRVVEFVRNEFLVGEPIDDGKATA